MLRRTFLLGAGASLLCPVPQVLADVLPDILPDVPAADSLSAATCAATGARRPDAARLRLVLGVRQALGKPYVWGAEGPAAFDCSGLIRWLYARVGLRLPRTACEQGSIGLRVRDRLLLGDVLLFRSQRSPSGWHNGMDLQGRIFVHAAGRDRGVILSLLGTRRLRHLVSVRRYLA